MRGKGTRTVTFDAGNTYAIQIDGAESVIKSMKITDFTPWIDVTDLEEGEHTVRLHVREIDGITVNSTPRITFTLG